MTAQETNVTIGAETTLSASLTSTATTINVTDTSGFPGVPFYVVIDADRDDKREVVLVDSGKTGTSFTLTSSTKRGQDGTAATSHDAGAIIAVVPVAALWTDINDRVDALPTTAHDHDGTDAAQIPVSNLTGHTKAAHDALALDHGSLSGLADDDHSFYPKGTLGYAEITSSQSGIGGTVTDITGLSATVTVGTSRRVRVTVFVPSFDSSTGTNARVNARIREGTSSLQQAVSRMTDTSSEATITATWIGTPSSGSHTYKASCNAVGDGTRTWNAGADNPSFILVEDIGPA